MENNNWKVITRTKYDSKKRAKRTRSILKNTIRLVLMLFMVIALEVRPSSAIQTSNADFAYTAGETDLVSVFTYNEDTTNTSTTNYISSSVSSDAIASVPHQWIRNDNSENIEASNELMIREDKEIEKKKNEVIKQEKIKKEKRKRHMLMLKKRRVREKKRLVRLKNKNYKSVPCGFGSVCSYMKWDLITSRDSSQYKLRIEAEHYNSKGMGMINGRFAVAVKPYYGDVGDLINVEYDNGKVLKAIVVEEKGHENEPGKGIPSEIYASNNAKQLAMGITNKVHTDGSVIEFCVDGDGDTTGVAFSGYGGSRTVSDLYPEYDSDIKGIYKVGSYWN